MKIRTTTIGTTLAFGIALAVPGRAGAQILTIGVKGGVNVSDVSIDDPDETFDADNITGLIGGGFVRIGGPVFAVQPELLFAQKGFSSDDFDGPNAELSLDYVEVPVLLSARLPSPLVRPFAYAGPVFSFETSCEISAEDADVSATADCDAEGVDIQTESTDVGIGLGAGVDVSLGRISLIGDIRYTLGLRDIDGTDDTSEVKNRAWSIMAGIGIPIL